MIKNIYTLAILLFGFLYVVQGRTVSSVGDISVDLNNGILTCGKIVCPSGTDHCVVTKENDANNPAVLVRSEVCYSASNEVLQQSVTNQNVNSNTKVHIRIEANTSGKTSVSNSVSNGNNSNGNQFGFTGFPGFPGFSAFTNFGR